MKKKYAFVVKVPKTPKAAYDQDRPISSLIEHQLKHLHEVEISLPKGRQTNIDITTLKTERQASDYIQKVTAELHPQGLMKTTKTRKSRTERNPPKNTPKRRPARKKRK